MKIKDLDLFLYESNAIEDVRDDRSFRQAKKAWNYLIKQDTLTPENIQHAHGILMKYHLPPEEAGHFRKCAVWIGGREAMPWVFVPSQMETLCFMANLSKTEDQIKEDHIKFERCHGFVDGNGRIFRIVLNWQRVKNKLPILVIEEATKYESYYPWFSL